MSSTALLAIQPAHAADLMLNEAEEPVPEAAQFSLAATGGIIGFSLPGMSSSVFTDDDDFDSNSDLDAIGGIFGASASAVVGQYGDMNVSVGLNGFVALAGGTGSDTYTFSGPGFLVVAGQTIPTGTITLATDAPGVVDPTASSTITATGAGLDQDPGSVIAANPDGGANAFFVTQNPGGFSLTGANTLNDTSGADDDLATAFGAIATGEGGLFIATGDLDGVEVTTDTSRDIVYAGADLTLAISGQASSNVTVQGYAGPSYRYLKQEGGVDVTVDMPEDLPVGGFEFPTYTQSSDDELTSHYLGGVVGLGMTATMGDGYSLSLGGELGLYGVSTDYEGTESYTIAGGNPALTAGDQTVENDTTVTDDDDSTAYAARINAVVSKQLDSGMTVSLGGQAEYLSRVATVSRDDLILGGGPAPGGAVAVGPGGNPGSISFGDMFNFTGTVSLTGHF